MLDQVRIIDVMREAIAEARKSRAEDDAIHPLVGAVVADASGRVLLRAHRGETGPGDHAEYALLRKAKDAGVNLTDTFLFVTLEPCTRRKPDKIPCAVRVAEQRFSRVFIGTLDPNPHITGKGEMFLSQHTEVEQFPWTLAKELMETNAEFFEQHKHQHIPAVSLYSGAGNECAELSLTTLRLSGQREGLLLQSADLIAGSSGDVCIFAGTMSWLRELQPVLLLCGLAERHVRILLIAGGNDTSEARRIAAIARSLGPKQANAPGVFA